MPPPIGTFTISDPENWVALFAFLTTAVIASKLSSNAKAREADALDRRNEMARLYELSRSLLMDEGRDAVRHSIMQAGQTLDVRSIAFFDLAGNQVYGSVEDALRPALEAGLLTREAQGYRFLHGRVHEAADAVNAESQRVSQHWHIGCRLLDGLSATELHAQCFEVADHLNRGAAADSADCDDRRQTTNSSRLRCEVHGERIG